MTTAPETADRLSPRMTAVLAHVAQQPDGVRAEQVAAATGLDETTARTYLRRLTDAGRITRTAPGLYAPRPIHETPEDTVPDAAIDPTDLDTDETLVVDLDDEEDQADQGDDQQTTAPGSLADELAQAQARADRLRAQVTAQQQAEARKQQERADEYDRRLVAQYDPFARRVERDALRGELRSAVERGELGLREYAALRATDDLAFEQGRLAAAAADRLRVPRPGGSGGPPPVYTPADLTSQLGVIVAEVAADIVQQERAEEQQRRQAYVEGRG